MRRSAAAGLVVVVAVLVLAATVWADGIVVPRAAVVKSARTPDQRALLRFDGACAHVGVPWRRASR